VERPTRAVWVLENGQPHSDAERLGEEPPEKSAIEPDRLHPQKGRVVDVEEKDTGDILRRDCYDPDGGAAEMGDVMRLKDGELWLRTMGWTRERSKKTLELTWEPTGLSPEEIGRVGVFTWPNGEAGPSLRRRGELSNRLFSSA
jgi:hypothetical protein